MNHSKAINIIFTLIIFYAASNILHETKLHAIDLLPSQGKKQNFSLSDGIANLKWGIPIEEALKIYPDLKKDMPDNTSDNSDDIDYIREKEDLNIAGYSMDSVKYNFLHGKLVFVSMNIRCYEFDSNKCDIDVMFQNIVKSMRDQYGKPYSIESRTNEDDETISKKGVISNYDIKWEVGDESICVSRSSHPKFPSLYVSVYSHLGEFIAIGNADAVAERNKIKHPTLISKKSKKVINYNLSEGFRSLKWGMNISDAKKIYPDLLFVEQLPLKKPDYFYYRRNNEDKSISGIDWDRVQYVFTKDKQFCAAHAESRYELEDKDKSIELFNEMFDKISAKYGKPSHYERADKRGYPNVYLARWDKESEGIWLRLEADIFRNHVIIKNTNTESTLSMLELSLHLNSQKGKGKALDF